MDDKLKTETLTFAMRIIEQSVPSNKWADVYKVLQNLNIMLADVQKQPPAKAKKSNCDGAKE